MMMNKFAKVVCWVVWYWTIIAVSLSTFYIIFKIEVLELFLVIVPSWIMIGLALKGLKTLK